MKKRLTARFALVLCFVVSGFFLNPCMASDDVPGITKEALITLLGTPDLILLDVRIESHWNGAAHKIKDAVRVNPKDFDTWSDTYPKQKTIVLY